MLEATDNPLIAEMLSAAREQAPRASTVKSTLLAVGGLAGVMGTQASASAAAGAGAGLTLAPLAKLGVTWTVLSVVVVGGGVASVEVAPTVLEMRGQRAEQAQQGLPAAAQPPGGRAAKHGGDRLEPEPSTALALDPGVANDAKDGIRYLTRDKAPEEHLRREVALLDAARRAHSDGRFRTALMLSARYLEAYPSGRLEQEARYLKLRAQRELGDAAGARLEAERLLELNPDGPHAAVAREVVEQRNVRKK